MARKARLLLPGVAHWAKLLAKPGQLPMADSALRHRLVALLRDRAEARTVEVLAFGISPHRIDVVLRAANPQHIALTMKHLAQCATRAQAQVPEGEAKPSPWEGRFRAGALDDVATLNALWCIDQVAAEQGEGFAWCSAPHWEGLANLPWLTAPQAWWALGNTPFARQAAYVNQREAFLAAESGKRARAVAEQAKNGWAQGSDEWLKERQVDAARPLIKKVAGRKPLNSVPN